MTVLEAVRVLRLPGWCVGGGVIRNMVWDHLHAHAKPSFLADVDVAYFESASESERREEKLERQLATNMPDVCWDVKNQAKVHQWFERKFGYTVPPLNSTFEAVGTWPETATAVGVCLTADDRLQILAPLGLDDLLSMVIRRNPTRVSVEIYRQRIAEKRYHERWPRVTVYPP